MRSSKSRSRSKSNRQRSMGNIVNRVFDSSGPEGKVRGTPQQIIDKYLALARDAQLGNDRVAEQNFLQHAEHYTRMLGQAQREQAREQEARNQQRQQNQNGNNDNTGGDAQNGDGLQNRQDERKSSAAEVENAATMMPPMPETEAEAEVSSTLVETPESKATSKATSKAKPKPDADDKPGTEIVGAKSVRSSRRARPRAE